MCSTNITTIWLILERANIQKVQLNLYHIWSSWWKYVWWSQREAVLYKTSTWETIVNIRCSTVTHQMGTLPIKSVEPSKLFIFNSFSGNRYGVETHGESFSATLVFSPTYHKSMLRNHVTWFYQGVLEL